MQTTIKSAPVSRYIPRTLFFSCIRPSAVHGHSEGECKMRIFMGRGRNVRQFHVGWHTNPQSSAASPTAPPSLFCLSSCMLCVRIRVPIAPHGSHICIYVRDDGSIVMRGRWQCKCDPGPEPHATTLCECIELSARAGGLQRGVCVIFAIYITTARDRIELRHCLKWGGYLFLNLIVLKLQLAKLLKYEKCLQIATSETKWKCYENKMFIHRKY